MITFDEEKLVISRGEWLSWDVVEMHYNDLIKEVKYALDNDHEQFEDTPDVIEDIIKYELTYADKKEIMSYIKDEAEGREEERMYCSPFDFSDDQLITTIIAQWLKDYFETETDFEQFVY
jgi:hypothetical protein